MVWALIGGLLLGSVVLLLCAIVAKVLYDDYRYNKYEKWYG